MTVWNPLVSIGVIALNEEDYLPRLLEDIRAQDYPLEDIELVLIDSGSTDGTREIMEAFAREHTEFHGVVVTANPKKILAPGWNIFLDTFSGEIAVRVDAHAQLPADFVSQIVTVMGEGEDVCGGDRPCIVPEDATTWQRVLLVAEESVFGASIAPYRGGRAQASDVQSLFHGAYRRKVIDSVGHLNEDLRRTEDNDFYYRMREAGYRLRLDPRIRSYQIVRATLRSMLKQKYGNGYWIGRTLFVQPRSVAFYHLVPGAFVASLAASAGLALTGKRLPFKLVVGSYLIANGVMSAAAMKSAPRSIQSLALPTIFPLLHMGYGIGTVRGVLDGLRNK